MEDGEGYYPASLKAFEEDRRDFDLENFVYVWRWPTIFYIWKIFTNSIEGIWTLFWILAGITLFCSYLIASISKINILMRLLSPILLAIYLSAVIEFQIYFLFISWWAIFFFVIGLTFFLYDYNKTAWSFWLLSLCTRELVIIPITFIAIISYIKRKSVKPFIILILVFVLFAYFHFSNTSEMLIDPNNTNISKNYLLSRIHFFDIDIWNEMVKFSTINFPFYKYKSYFWILLISLFGLIRLFLNRNYQSSIWYVFLPAWGTMLILPIINSNKFTNYYGILFIPLILISVSLAFFKLSIKKSLVVLGIFFLVTFTTIFIKNLWNDINRKIPSNELVIATLNSENKSYIKLFTFTEPLATNSNYFIELNLSSSEGFNDFETTIYINNLLSLKLPNKTLKSYNQYKIPFEITSTDINTLEILVKTNIDNQEQLKIGKITIIE